ncbi:MAG: hypothetical protein AABY22_21735, partial [Nanoarchaeota archaeon]
ESIENFIKNEYPEFTYVLRTMNEMAENMQNDKEKEQFEDNNSKGVYYAIKDKNAMFNLFKKPKIIGLVSDANKGKSNLIYWILTELNKRYYYKKYAYGLRSGIEGAVPVCSIAEIEQLRNSLIVIDEFSSLFDVENRKARRLIEKTLRLVFHNNNIVLLSGLGENFKKFISAKLSAIIYKKTTIADLINGSTIKNVLLEYQGLERGSAVLDLQDSEAIVFDGLHYNKIDIPYLPEFDTKRQNVQIFVPKNVHKIVQK